MNSKILCGLRGDVRVLHFLIDRIKIFEMLMMSALHKFGGGLVVPHIHGLGQMMLMAMIRRESDFVKTFLNVLAHFFCNLLARGS